MDLFAPKSTWTRGVAPSKLIEKDDFPTRHPVDDGSDVGDYQSRALDLALEVAGYDDLRAEQVRRRTAGDVRQLASGCRATWRSRTDCRW